MLPMPAQRQPLFFGPDPSMVAQAGAGPASPVPAQAPPQQSAALLDAMRARAMSDGLNGSTAAMHASDPWSALAQGLNGGLEGWAGGRALDRENTAKAESDKAFADALDSGDPLKSLLQSANPAAREFGMKWKLESLQKTPAGTWTDVDRNNDGTPDAQRNSQTGEYKPIETPRTFEQDLQLRAASAPSTTINMGGEKEFEKETGKQQATLFADIAKDGYEATADAASIDELGENLKKLPGGMQGGIQSFALSWGVPLGKNATEAQAAKAIIARLIPRQRPPGSGSSSNLDINMFADSLPQLTNTPGGNALILETMRGLVQRRIDAGRIAAAAQNGQITRQEATEALANLPDPLKQFRAKMKNMKLPATTRKVLKFNPATGQVE